MAVNIRGLTRIKSQALVNFPPTPSLNLDFTTPYVNGLNPLPSTVTFSRADVGGAYATHVGPDGLVRRAAHNLLTYSETFNNSSVWTVVSASVSQNVITAPNGSLTASKIVEANTTGGHNFDRAGTYTINDGVVYTFSFYIKYGGRRYITFGGTNNPFIPNLGGMIDTLNGTVVSGNVRLQNVGDGWYRIISSFIGNGTGTGSWANIRFSFYATSDVNGWNYTGDGTSGFYIWGAQLEQNITPSYYVPTTSAAVYSTPRFDYDPVTLQPKGLLIEEARTNIQTYSNGFSSWTGGSAATSTTALLSPEGTTNAWLYTQQTSTSMIYPAAYASLPSTGYATNSIYVKAGNVNYVYMTCANYDQRWSVVVNLTNGVVENTYVNPNPPPNRSTVVTYVGNGWYRIAMTYNANVRNETIILIAASRTASATYDTGGYGFHGITNATAGDTIYLYGAQIEAGNFASSYIPTTSGSVTRARDDVLLSGTANTIASGAVGTMYIETTSLKTRNSGLTDQILFGNAVKDQLYRSVNNGNTLYTYYFRSTIGTVNSADWTNPVKSIVAFDASSVSICLAGGAVVTGSGSGTIGGNTYVGSDGTGAQFINGNVRQVLLYDFRMPDNKLPIITKG